MSRESYTRWRDCHADWKQIKDRLEAQEEENRRAEEEEEALRGPAMRISIEKEVRAEQQIDAVSAQQLARALASIEI